MHERKEMIPFFPSIVEAELGEDVVIRPFCNLWGRPRIGSRTTIGAYTEIGREVVIGEDCKIGAYVFIPPGVTIGNRVFIGPQVGFCNDKHPQAMGEWTMEHTTIEDDVSIGLGAKILPGIVIGKGAKVGAGALVVKDVAPGETVISPRATLLSPPSFNWQATHSEG